MENEFKETIAAFITEEFKKIKPRFKVGDKVQSKWSDDILIIKYLIISDTIAYGVKKENSDDNTIYCFNEKVLKKYE